MTGILRNLLAVVLAFGAAVEPGSKEPFQIELTLLNGQRHAGALVALEADHASLKVDKANVEVPLSEVLELRARRAKPPLPPDPRRPELALTDGSRLFWTALRVADRQVFVETPLFGKVTLPLSYLGSVRLSPVDPQVADAWKELTGRELTQDMLVIRKGNVLDHLDGTIGNLDDTSVRFIFDGKDGKEEIPARREKVFGVIYARRAAETGKPVCKLATVGGDILNAQSAQWTGGQLKISLLGHTQLVISADQILSLDFSLGKVRYLSQLEPRDVKYTAFFDQVWTYCRDRPRDGGALRLGNKEYTHGLWIHSRTRLKYRLNGEYRRFQAVMGIDQAVAPLGNVHVVISGDGRTLHEGDVRGTDPPQNLDLDVASVREFEIFVDFGGDLDIADHLDLADARVIK